MRIYVAALLSASLFLCSCQFAFADEILLQGAVRDFKRGDQPGGHPDFEGPITFLTTGMLQNTLPADKVPVFVGAPGFGGVQNASSYRQWYTDVPDVNLPSSLSIALSNAATGNPDVFRFESDAFFPIDGAYWGNEGLTHNFHFTYAINTQLMYEPGARFRFRGDDDLWLFIDNRLVVDLGGVHPPAEAIFDIDSLGLTPGNAYDFDLYFAERHTDQSHFLVEVNFNFVPEPTLSGPIACVALGLFLRAVLSWRTAFERPAASAP